MRAPRLAVFACALGLALLAGCQSSNSCGMGGSSGYQIDGAPGLMACSMAAGSNGMASTMTTNPNDPAAVALNSGFNQNGYLGFFYPMARTTAALPTASGTGDTLSLPGGTVPAVANPGASDYALTASTTGYNPVCEIASGSHIFAANAIYAMSGTSATLRVYYPPFSMGTPGSFTINCVGVKGAAVTALTSITVTFP
jgi:hypothetical protein